MSGPLPGWKMLQEDRRCRVACIVMVRVACMHSQGHNHGWQQFGGESWAGHICSIGKGTDDETNAHPAKLADCMRGCVVVWRWGVWM